MPVLYFEDLKNEQVNRKVTRRANERPPPRDMIPKIRTWLMIHIVTIHKLERGRGRWRKFGLEDEEEEEEAQLCCYKWSWR